MLETYIFSPFEELKKYDQILNLAQRNLDKNINIEQNVYMFFSLRLQAESWKDVASVWSYLKQ